MFSSSESRDRHRAAKFRKLVRLRELGMTVDEIYAIGKKFLRESKKALVRLSGEIHPALQSMKRKRS